MPANSLYYKIKKSLSLYKARLISIYIPNYLNPSGNWYITRALFMDLFIFINTFTTLNYLISRLKYAIITTIIRNERAASVAVYINIIKDSF